MSSYEKAAQSIIEGVGGPGNISEVSHCFTRLRFKLVDPSLTDDNGLKKLPEVAGIARSGGTYQVIVGQSIDGIYKAVTAQLNGKAVGQSPTPHEEKHGLKYWGGQILNAISATITPILSGLVVTGLFKAFLSIAVLCGWLATDSQTYILLNMMGDSFFYFLPFLVAYSASVHFGCNTVIALILAGILMHPTFSQMVSDGGAISLFGLPVHAISYSASLLPMLITVWIQSLVEKGILSTRVRNWGLLLSQLPIFLIMAPLTLLVTGPFGSIIGEVIADAMLSLYQNFYVLGVFMVSFLMPLFILTGSHWVFMPTALSNMQTMGFDPFLWVGFAVINFSQLGVSLAIFLKAKNRDLKSFAGSAVLPIATAGITEPCMFGLTLKLKKPLIATFIACAVGGLYCGLTQVKVYELVTVSLVSLPQFIDPAGSNNFVLAIIGMGITFAVAFIATWFIGFDENDFEDEKEPSPMVGASKENVDFVQPVPGEVKPLSECSDPAFAKGALGNGILIMPSEGTVVAPFDGTITATAETGHALGLTSDSGSEDIIHLGIDTVELKGAPFSVKVTQGQRVRAGQLLETFDINAIESAGKSAETVVLMSNPQPLAAVK